MVLRQDTALRVLEKCKVHTTLSPKDGTLEKHVPDRQVLDKFVEFKAANTSFAFKQTKATLQVYRTTLSPYSLVPQLKVQRK